MLDYWTIGYVVAWDYFLRQWIVHAVTENDWIVDTFVETYSENQNWQLEIDGSSR